MAKLDVTYELENLRAMRGDITRAAAQYDRTSVAGFLADPKLAREFSYVGGEWLAAGDGRTIEVRDPSTGTSLGREGARLGMEAFMDVKYVCRDGN